MAPTPDENPAPYAGKSLTKDTPDIENLMGLNPKIKPYANAVPSAVTKKAKKHWKRNVDKSENLKGCGWVFTVHKISGRIFWKKKNENFPGPVTHIWRTTMRTSSTLHWVKEGLWEKLPGAWNVLMLHAKNPAQPSLMSRLLLVSQFPMLEDHSASLCSMPLKDCLGKVRWHQKDPRDHQKVPKTIWPAHEKV